MTASWQLAVEELSPVNELIGRGVARRGAGLGRLGVEGCDDHVTWSVRALVIVMVHHAR